MKYTLDRIEEGNYVFLIHPTEDVELVIPFAKVALNLAEGDVVEINQSTKPLQVKLLKEETKITKDTVNLLLEKLKSKNN